MTVAHADTHPADTTAPASTVRAHKPVLAVQGEGQPIAVTGFARLVRARWLAKQPRPKPTLVVANDQSRRPVSAQLEGHLRRLD